MPAEDFPLISDLLNDASAGNEVSSANATNGVALDGSASSNAPGLNGHVQREESPLTEVEEPLTWKDNGSIDRISQNMRAMVKKIQDLRHLGIEDKGLPLPKICVVGDQSAGKSSLIEGMSEIKVPRSAGTCTRCPLEINLSEGEPGASWTCRVLLSKKYMFDFTPAKGKQVTRTKPLGPWVEQDPEETLFATLTKKDEVQEALRWAQLATLNPGQSPEAYMIGHDAGTDPLYTQVKFSPNVIRLDISAPGFPNLSFFDLPGVINVTEIDDEKYLVTLVENLVRDYIKSPNCIVLLAMPMTDDATNSSAARIIREVPGARDRTMGVLTKPDRIQCEEGYDQWLEILRGSKFSIGHGYYVVKNNPNPLVDHSQARREELHFFSRPPWTTELNEFSDRFGTRHLQGALSKLLLGQIENSLPSIRDQINARLQAVDAELVTLPDPPTANIPFILCDKLHFYSTNIKSHLDGGLRGYPFQKQWGQIAADFQKYITDSRPTLKLREEHPNWRNSVFPGSGDPDLEITFTQPSPSKRKASTNGETEFKRIKILASPAPGARPTNGNNKGDFITDHFAVFKAPARTFRLEEIRDIDQETYRSGVPGLGNPQAVEMLNQLSVAHWKEPMEKFLYVTYAEIYKVLIDEVDKVFKEYSRTNLYRELQSIIFEFLESIRQDHLKAATECFNVECQKPFTMATTSFQRSQKEALALLTNLRRGWRVQMYVEEMQSRVEANGGRVLPASKVTDTELGPDEFGKEIEIMSAVRAYYDIAGSRFVDAICQSIYTKLFFKCQNELREYIQTKLGIQSENASERCKELMVEDNEREQRRQFLRKEKVKLEKAQASLRQVPDPDDDELFVAP